MQEFIFRCDFSGKILQVVFQNELPELFEVESVTFTDMLHADSFEKGTQFLTDVQFSGRADNRFLYMHLNNSQKLFSCSGVSLAGQLFISGLETSIEKASLAASGTVPDFSENLKTDFETETPGYEEMFEELSRLNNELINAKRELIRKNKELERFQMLLKKDKPGS